VTGLAVALMVVFHIFIISTFPLAVPLEWNVLFGYLSVFLFWDSRCGTAMASPTCPRRR
jgi:hypothetical protein